MNKYVTIKPLIGSRPVRVLLGSQPAAPMADGGWSVQSRPKKSGFTVWDGYAPYTMELSVMFDGFAEGESQEERIKALFSIMRDPVGPQKQPSPVKLRGAVPMRGTAWVIQDISIDQSTLLRKKNGDIVRAGATISLLEYVEADLLVSATPSPVAKVSEKSTAQRTHTFVSGDTLSGIAAKYLGSWTRYTEIMTLNGIRDARSVPIGTVLRLP